MNAYQGHLAARRRRVRRVRQRQDGDQVQFRPLPGAGDQRPELPVEQPGATASSDTASRNWTDTNGNKVVDCDILNPAAADRRWRHVRRADRRCAQLRQAGCPDAGRPGILEWLGRAAGRLAVGHQPAAGAAPARVAGGRLQPALVGELHGHRQHADDAGGLSRSGRSSRRTIRACPAAAATRSTSTR